MNFASVSRRALPANKFAPVIRTPDGLRFRSVEGNFRHVPFDAKIQEDVILTAQIGAAAALIGTAGATAAVVTTPITVPSLVVQAPVWVADGATRILEAALRLVKRDLKTSQKALASPRETMRSVLAAPGKTVKIEMLKKWHAVKDPLFSLKHGLVGSLGGDIRAWNPLIVFEHIEQGYKIDGPKTWDTYNRKRW